MHSKNASSINYVHTRSNRLGKIGDNRSVWWTERPQLDHKTNGWSRNLSLLSIICKDKCYLEFRAFGGTHQIGTLMIIKIEGDEASTRSCGSRSFTLHRTLGLMPSYVTVKVLTLVPHRTFRSSAKADFTIAVLLTFVNSQGSGFTTFPRLLGWMLM